MNNYCIKNITDFSGIQKDLYINSGVLSSTAEKFLQYKTIEGRGKIVFPLFADMHTHLDKTFTFDRITPPAEDLIDAIVKTNSYMREATREDFISRGRRMMNMSLCQGTGFIRSHITLSPELELKAWDAALFLQKELASLMTLQLVMFPGEIREASLSDPNYHLLIQAIKKGGKILGGCPTLSSDYKRYMDILFDAAEKYDLTLDMHIDESDAPDAKALEYAAQKTIETGMSGKVTAGHCTSLNALPFREADRIINKVRQAGINIVTLPSCNLYLMGRKDTLKQRRGTTRINEFLNAGVNISLASDNIRDPFRPFGRGDMLEEALLTAQLTQRGNPESLKALIQMITHNPARAMQLENYGLFEGKKASMVLIDGTSPLDALINQGEKTHIFRRGELILEKETQLRQPGDSAG